MLEAAISVALLAGVLQTAVSASVVMARSGEFGMSEIERNARADDVLARIANEVRNSSRETDESGVAYMQVAGDPGSEVLTFRRVATFGENGAEVVPMFSTPIELYRDGDRLMRRQDGVETVLATNVESLDFELDALGRVDVQIGFARETAGAAGFVQHALHGLRITPQR